MYESLRVGQLGFYGWEFLGFLDYSFENNNQWIVFVIKIFFFVKFYFMQDICLIWIIFFVFYIVFYISFFNIDISYWSQIKDKRLVFVLYKDIYVN